MFAVNMNSFVQFNNYLKVLVPPHLCSPGSKWYQIYGQKARIIDYSKLDSTIQSEFDPVSLRMMMFNEKLQAVMPLSLEIKDSIQSLTWFSSMGRSFHPWLLLKHFGFESIDVFTALVNSNPFGVGAYKFRHIPEDRMSELWNEIKLKHVLPDKTHALYFDYYNGVAMKMAIPKDLQQTSDEDLQAMSVDYNRYDDRNVVSFATKLSQMLYRKCLWIVEDKALTKH